MRKRRAILFIVTLSMIYIVLAGYKAGPGSKGWDCTGAESGLGNPAGCHGSKCHATAANSSIDMTVELDSTGGVPTTHYIPGATYTVKLFATNNTALSLTKFGLQIGSIKGATAAATPVNAGSWPAPYPTDTHFASPQAGNFVVGVVEHTAPLSPASGSGGSGTTYSQSFNWTAPAKGTGTISIWSAINAVNNDGTADAGDTWNLSNIVINEWTSITGIDNSNAVARLQAYPNPVVDQLNLKLTNELGDGKYTVTIFDLDGKRISTQIFELHDASQLATISTDSWQPGIHAVLIEKDKLRMHVNVIKH